MRRGTGVGARYEGAHGAAARAPVQVGDLGVATELDRVAASICGPQVERLEREQALIVAEAQVTLKRVRRARTRIMEQMLLVPVIRDPDAQGSAPLPADRNAAYLDQLLRLDRYEGGAVWLASFRDP